MNTGFFVAAIEREASKPTYPDALRAQVAELRLVGRRHDAGELLEIARREGLDVSSTIALFRRPRVVS